MSCIICSRKNRVALLAMLLGLLLPVTQCGALLQLNYHTKTPNVAKTLILLASKGEEHPKKVEYNDFLPIPNPSLSGPDVVAACMDTMLNGNRDEGLEVCYHFSSDRCRAAQGGSLENFRSYADNPTFGFLIECDAWKKVSTGPVIRGTQHRGSMQTVLMSAQKTEDERTFLWTLQQERRPPLEGCWMVHEVLYVDNAFLQTV